MCYARRQRSSWARIKLSKKWYVSRLLHRLKSFLRVNWCCSITCWSVISLWLFKKFKRIFGVFVLWSSKYMNLVVQFSMSCAFRCIALRLAAYLLYHFVVRLSRGFSNFFQVFFVLSPFADLAVPLSCSSDSIPHSSPLVNPFLQVFSGFFDFSCQ